MFRIETALDNNSNLWSFNQETNQLEFAYKDDILSEYQALFKNIFPDINTDPSTPQGQIITSLTQTDLATISYLENLANAFFLGGNGYFLDLWAWNLFRVTRKQGIPSSALITIQGVAGTEIPEDFLISDNQYNYKISQSVIIPSTGTIDVLFYCTEINEFIANPNTITQIVTIVNGVERVNNTNMATPAILKETDGELFQRCVYFGSTARNASFRSILANVAEVIGVNRIAGAENVTNEPLEVSGVTLTPHSICLVVDGGENEDIANAMFNSRATGCDMVGDTEVTILLDNQKYTYKFYRPTAVPLKAEVKVSATGAIIPSNYESEVKNVLSKFINNLDINKNITQPLLANNLIKNITDLNILDIQFGLKSGNVGYTNIQLKLNEIASISVDDITVTQGED
ncbi:baseplate J/gp47 family protein [Campylobacter coli]|nr:baseplate J/gp47 family protein [Campylobacter coli]